MNGVTSRFVPNLCSDQGNKVAGQAPPTKTGITDQRGFIHLLRCHSNLKFKKTFRLGNFRLWTILHIMGISESKNKNILLSHLCLSVALWPTFHLQTMWKRVVPDEREFEDAIS